jgi:hypothetical protein
MTPKRLWMALLLTIFVGNLAGSQIPKRTQQLCPACTTYCKQHPNSPRCL